MPNEIMTITVVEEADGDTNLRFNVIDNSPEKVYELATHVLPNTIRELAKILEDYQVEDKIFGKVIIEATKELNKSRDNQ